MIEWLILAQLDERQLESLLGQRHTCILDFDTACDGVISENVQSGVDQ